MGIDPGPDPADRNRGGSPHLDLHALSRVQHSMDWNDWNEQAFDRAREAGVPVLLFLRTSWCHWCRELEEKVFADPTVAGILVERTVPVMVDKDRRPDIDSRYRQGGWPTVALLDAEGEVLTTGNFMEGSELISMLDGISNEGASTDKDVGRKAPSAEPHAPLRSQEAASLSIELVDEITTHLINTSDPIHGGWGARHKFPHPEALHFLIVRWSQTGAQDTLDLVLRTLREMQRGEIHDQVEGGFYRYATQPDWSVPHHEKMLDSNAKRMLAYVEAYQALGDESFRATAEGIIEWMQATLLDSETNCFKNSQDADSTYAHLSTAEARARHGAPDTDPTLFTNYNANAVAALSKASIVLCRPELAEQAGRTLDFLMQSMCDESDGLHHFWDGTYNLPGMLTDQAATLRALIEFMHYTGDNRYLDQACSLARRTLEELRTPEGAFFDTRHDPHAWGGLRERNTSILENATMAEALIRLGHMTRDMDMLSDARRALEAFLEDHRRYGHHVAAYARAIDLLLLPPVHVTIVGERDAEQTKALRHAALRPYVANRLVQTIDPERDPALFERAGLPRPDGAREARAYVDQGYESYAETSRPERLPALMARAERSN